MLLPTETVNYIIEFLLMQPNKNLISYSENPTTAPITIIPANDINEPVLPANIRITSKGNNIIFHDDIITSTFFLLSRYDEFRQPDAVDTFHRFLSGRSFLGSHGLMQTPIIDIYTEIIYQKLNQPIPHRQQHLYLTHDIDTISHYHRLVGFCGGIFRTLFKNFEGKESFSTIIASAVNIKNDPAYTFQQIADIDSKYVNHKSMASEIIYFIKPNRAHNRYDRPAYHLKSVPKLSGTIGYHSLYETFDNVALLTKPQTSKIPHKYHRSHYLRILPPTQMHNYINAGITDDFSICYADVPGFRLGTTRPSKAINPANAQVLSLTLHPLSVMDTTLIDSRYLNLDYEHALNLCLSLFETINKHQGDITLLFHNNSFANPMIAKLYPELLSRL